ncbi:MAG: hypothetical protein H6670_14115 [Anaerolineaceae bacterium]|nr:hypothetical protein [Anaerolineaceae bacterium]
MHSIFKRTITVGIVMIIAFSAVMTVFAAVSTGFEEFAVNTSVNSLTIPGVTFSGGPEFKVNTASPFTTFSGNYISGGGSGTLTITFDSPQSHASMKFAQAANPFQVTAMLNGSVVNTVQFTGTVGFNEGIASIDDTFDQLVLASGGFCSGCFAIDDLVTEDAGVSSVDNRLNWHYGDATIAILYPGDNAVDVYDYATGNYIFNFITANDVPDTPPDQNTIIRQEGNIMVSILTTGEIQFNLGPDAEGKSYVFIMGDIYGSNLYGFKYDPSE